MIWPFSRNQPEAEGLVTHAAFHGQVDEVVSRALAAHSLTLQAKGTWVGEDGPARPMFQLVEWQGGSFRARWGIALACVPHVEGRRALWHRTRTSARPDIFVDAPDTIPEMSRLHSATRTADAVDHVMAACLSKAAPFWQRAQDPSSWPALLEDAKVMSDHASVVSYRHALPCVIASAFVPAYLGQTAMAQAAWDQIEAHPALTEARDPLRARFDALLAS